MQQVRRAIRAAASTMAVLVCPDDLRLLHRVLPAIRDRLPSRNERTNTRLVLALISAEDHRFLHHMGVEVRSVIRAARGVMTGRYSGGSTIEQQLIRVVRGRYEFTLRRKLTEIVLALAIYERFEKDDIARMYAEIAYYGWRGSGLENIARRLNYDLSAITQQQAIVIMSLLKRPLPRSPSGCYKKKLTERMAYVQRRFEKVCTTEGARELLERARS